MSILKRICRIILRLFGISMLFIGIKQQHHGYVGYSYISLAIGAIVLYFSTRGWTKGRFR